MAAATARGGTLASRAGPASGGATPGRFRPLKRLRIDIVSGNPLTVPLMFELHPRLTADTLPLGDFPLCRCLLMNDMHYPWLILVPRVDEAREIFELTEAQQQQLIRESSYVSERLARFFDADKINIGALGNMVPQLHIHHIARYANDAAWPGPVWGKHPAQPYTDDNLKMMRERLSAAFADADMLQFEWAPRD